MYFIESKKENIKITPAFLSWTAPKSACHSSPCLHGGTCLDSSNTADVAFNANGYKCLCTAGFIGMNCEGKPHFARLLALSLLCVVTFRQRRKHQIILRYIKVACISIQWWFRTDKWLLKHKRKTTAWIYCLNTQVVSVSIHLPEISYCFRSQFSIRSKGCFSHRYFCIS